MPMNRDDHEAILNELLNPEIEHSTRTELLQKLRVDYGSVLTDFDKSSKDLEKLQKDNSDLVLSNSKLFRQIGLQDDEPKQKEEEQKEFSQTVTIEEIEKGL